MCQWNRINDIQALSTDSWPRYNYTWEKRQPLQQMVLRKLIIFMSRSKTRFLSLFLHNDQGSQHKTSNFKTIRKNGSTFQDKAIGRNFLNSTSLYSGKKTNNWQIKSHHFFLNLSLNVHGCFPICIHTKKKKKHHIPWDYCKRQLWASM